MMQKHAISALVALLAALSSASASTIYPLNDGFETPNLGSGSLSYAYPGLPNGVGPLTGGLWTFVGGGGIAANGSAFFVSGASNGNQNGGATSSAGQAGFLQGGDGTLTGSAIYQTVALPSGNAVLNFIFEGRQGYGLNGVNIFLDGIQIGSTLSPSTFTTFAPQSVNLGYITAGNHVLGFAGNNYLGGDKTTFIDNVSITSTTVPDGGSTCALLGLGLMGVGFLRRKLTA